MNTQNSRLAVGLALGAVAAFAACNSSNRAPASTTQTSQGAISPDTAARTAASVSGDKYTDANIAAILDAANMSDSSFGAMANTKAVSADVKQFAQLMMGEHHALRAQGQALVKKLNVTPMLPSNFDLPKHQQDAMADLQKKTGRDFDKAYIDHEIDYHQQVLKTAQDLLAQATNQELKDLIQKAAPIIQKHLDMAKQIQSKMTAA